VKIKLYHSLSYTTDGTVPVYLVARSLLANERLVRESLLLMEELHKNELQISPLKISVATLSNESPFKEVLAVTAFVAWQKDLEKEVPHIIEMLTGNRISPDYDTLITVLVMFLAIYLIDSIFERVMPGKSVKAIKEEYEHKKLMVAGLLKLSPERLEEVVKHRYENEKGKSLINKALDFFAPAKVETGVEITTGNDIKIPSNVIQAIPPAVHFARLKNTNSYELKSAAVEIHRADRDETKHGWRAIIKDVSERKVRMELDQSINPDRLFGNTVVRGDVTVIEEMQNEGGYQAKVYFLHNVQE